ncbi:MAG: glutathione S-transferase family protein [Acetobacteraceae bacterium]|jgi:glutathione S-transferase
MLRIHGSARSRAQRTLWMTFELGIPYEHDNLLPRSPGTKTPAFLTLNPNARLPVIEDDGFVLYESMAINFYLAKKHNSPLYPSNPRDEALALQWSFWETDRLDRNLANYVTHTTGLPEAERDKSIADAAWAEVEPAMNVLNAALSKTPWLAGPAFSIADLNVAGALWRGLAMDLSHWPAVKDWLARCWDRPAGKKARAMREG